MSTSHSTCDKLMRQLCVFVSMDIMQTICVAVSVFIFYEILEFASLQSALCHSVKLMDVT